MPLRPHRVLAWCPGTPAPQNPHSNTERFSAACSPWTLVLLQGAHEELTVRHFKDQGRMRVHGTAQFPRLPVCAPEEHHLAPGSRPPDYLLCTDETQSRCQSTGAQGSVEEDPSHGVRAFVGMAIRHANRHTHGIGR